jgi:hypothetical protein
MFQLVDGDLTSVMMQQHLSPSISSANTANVNPNFKMQRV